MLSPLLNLFYPDLCAACKQPLFRNEKCICTLCFIDLPYTHYHKFRDNPVERLFWGRSPICFATALCFFSKTSRMQHILHQLKYKGNQTVGQILGQELGKQLVSETQLPHIDCIVPVPLHPRKEKLRGYNQSLSIAKGIAEIIDRKIETQLLFRQRYNDTQTKRSRYDRAVNVNELFAIRCSESIRGKHVLLVDDVITTGATLESCSKLLINEGAKVSVAVLACA